MAKVTFTIHKAGKHQRHSRRNQILDAAQRCFKKQGFHKTTLRDIAQEFGMSAGHIYNYFSNKEAIIEALVELRTQEFLDMIDTDKFADLPPEERMDKELGQVVDAYLNLDNTSLSIAIMNEALINPKVYEIVVAAASKVRNHIVEAQLLAMKEERRYAPPYEVIESRCMTIRAMLEGLRLAHIFTPEMDVPLVREMAIKRIKQIIALDEAEDQAAAAAEAKLKAEAMACAYYPVSEKPEALGLKLQSEIGSLRNGDSRFFFSFSFSRVLQSSREPHYKALFTATSIRHPPSCPRNARGQARARRGCDNPREPFCGSRRQSCRGCACP